ncbi:Sulfur carrier protein FdhD [Azospirillaceae bacterium]
MGVRRSDLEAEDCNASLRRVFERRVDLTQEPSSSQSGKGLDPFEVPVEIAVGIIYGKGVMTTPYAVLMASPMDVEDLAIGFSLTEGVIESVDEALSIEIARTEDGLAVAVDVSGKSLSRCLARRRALVSRTGCGVCGVEDIESLPKAPRPPVGPAPDASKARLSAMLAALEAQQALNARTRAVHAAAWFDGEGRLVAVREDIGRHNALDKLIGALTRAGVRSEGGAALITSRCSFEMIEKAAVFGARLVVAVSAPTSLAIDRARTLGMTLVAVARRDAALLFTSASAQELGP